MRSAVTLALAVSFLPTITVLGQDPTPIEAGTLPRVVVLATGGTIASRFDAEAGTGPARLTGEQIVAAVPGLADVASVGSTRSRTWAAET